MAYHYYTIHHLIIASGIALPELFSVAPQPEDIRIVEGVVPLHLPNLKTTKQGLFTEGTLHYELQKDTLLLIIPNVMRVLIKGSTSILFQADNTTDYGKIRWYLFDVCLVLLLLKRGLFPFHGSAVQTPYGAVLFVGASGWGKSTLAARFMQEGNELLTDDVCVVRLSANTLPYAYPSSRRLKLLDHSINTLGYNPTQFVIIADRSPKKQMYIDRSTPTGPQPLKAIYQLWPDEVSAAEIQSLGSHEKLAAVAGNTFLWEPVALFNLQRSYFTFCSTIARTVSVKRVLRPLSGFDIDAMYVLLIQDLQNMSLTRSDLLQPE